MGCTCTPTSTAVTASIQPSASQLGVHACLSHRGVLAAACALHQHGCTFLCGAAAVCIVNCCIGQCQHGRQGCLIGHPQASWWPSDDPADHNSACGKLATPPCRVSCTLSMQTYRDGKQMGACTSQRPACVLLCISRHTQASLRTCEDQPRLITFSRD